MKKKHRLLSNQLPQPIQNLPASLARGLKALVTDIDDTFTLHDQIPAYAYEALEKVQAAGLKTFFTTGRPAGYAEILAKWFPVNGVIAENGGCFFYKARGKLQHGYIQSPAARETNQRKLQIIEKEILSRVPNAALAKDQWLRKCDLAIDYCEEVKALGKEDVKRIVEVFEKHGAQAKVSSIHVNGWFGNFDKFSTFKFVLKRFFNGDFAKQSESFIYLGDSPNDEPLFQAFPHSIGVANIKKFLPTLAYPPQWLTRGEGAQGFAEAVHLILQRR